MKRGKFALLFILKDEEVTIKNAIEAFHEDGIPLYNRLVIAIDDSTKDDTYNIVKKYTDEISYFTWDEDFSKHRNVLIDKIEIGWYIVFPDGHEVLRPKGKEVLKEFLEKHPSQTNIFSPFIEIDVDEFDIADIVFKRPIVFRNTGKIKFRRKVHNFLYDEEEHKICSIPQMCFIHNMPSKRKDMRHEMRKDMNTRKLKESLKKNPNDTRDTFYLADVYDEVGQINKAINEYQKSYRLAVNSNDNDLAAQICICILNSLDKGKQNKAAIDWAYTGMKKRWDRAELYYFLGLHLSRLGDYEQAIHWYEVCSKMALPLDTSYFLMGKVYSWYPWDGIMYCKDKLGDFEGAIFAAQKVLEWKTNKKTGDPCPIMIRNIELLKNKIKDAQNDVIAKGMLTNNSTVSKDAAKILGSTPKLHVV